MSCSTKLNKVVCKRCQSGIAGVEIIHVYPLLCYMIPLLHITECQPSWLSLCPYKHTVQKHLRSSLKKSNDFSTEYCSSSGNE